MMTTNGIIKLAERNNGIVTAGMVTHAGFKRGCLKYLADKGDIERIARGVYALPEAWEDEFVVLQSRYKRGVYSLDTALFLCDLTDRTPMRMNMTFPGTYNMTSPKKDGVLCNCVKEPLYSMGITRIATPSGNLVMAYRSERTLCDMLRARHHADIQVTAEAFKRYMARKGRDIPLLSKYAKALKVEKKLRSYMEVLS